MFGSEDHPRTRGEKTFMGAHLGGTLGSPPHARGKGVRDWDELPGKGSPPHARGKAMASSTVPLIIGITPARAGKRKSPFRPLPGAEDHPRTRGEKMVAMLFSPPHIGSPPHARGKEMARTSRECICRITPARAGKSNLLFDSEHTREDHPRTRGEKCHNFPRGNTLVGSPPHARGKAIFNSQEG